MNEVKEVRKCVNCQKWFKRKDTENVSTGSEYIPRFSSIEGHTNHDLVPMCHGCISKMFDSSEHTKYKLENFKS